MCTRQSSLFADRLSAPGQGIGWLILLGFCLLLFAGCGPRTGGNQGVQLVLSTEELGPGTTFQLRFDEPIRPANAVTEPSPLVFFPPVKGRFTWTSPRSGTFTPEEPLALATQYRLSLRNGLLRADGQPAQARLQHTLTTPPFGVSAWHGPDPGTNVYSEPQFKLWFNADARATAVAAHARFINAEGRSIPATVRQGTEEDAQVWGIHGSRQTWTAEFLASHAGPAPARTPTNPEEPASEVSNLMVLSPMQPLTPGKDWSLQISAGVASADGRHRSPGQFKASVGDVQPFLFESAAMHHVINQGPWLEAKFSKPIPLTLTNAFTNWIRIVPRPENLSASVWGRTLRLAGDWQRYTPYAVSIARGFPAEEAFLLSSNINLSLEVPPIDPRLYFPAFTTDQLATGHRAFPLLAVNVPRVRVRAKLLSDATAIHALRGYSSYQEGRWLADNPDPDGYRRLDYKLVPGRTVFDEQMPGSQTADQAEEIKLSWDQFLQGRKTGILFIEAEQAASDGWTSALGTQALVQLTDLGLVWKSGGGQVHVFVFSYASGQPVSNVRLQLCSHENQVFQEASTDASGLATLQTHTNASWLLARHDEDLHAVALNENTVSTWWFDALRNQPWQDPADLRRVALFTDRTAYRPGETVQLKAIARDFLDAGLAIPAGLTGVVTCANSRGKSFFETNVLLSALGSCETSIAVPEDARGAYLASLRLGGREYFKAFQVADFQTPAFDLQLECKPSFAATETPAVQVGARYFFGQSLHAAQIRWWLSAHDAGFQPEPFSQYQFTRCDDETRWGRKSGSFSADGADQLSAATNRVIAADIPLNPEAPQPRAVSVLVEVTDLNQQTISRAAEFTRHSSAFYLGLKRFERVLVPGQPLPLQVAAVAADGLPWAEQVNARLALYRVNWETVRVRGAGRTARYRSEATLKKLSEQPIPVTPLRLSGQNEWEPCAIPDLVTPEAGEYLLELTAQDPAGHPVAASLAFDVSAHAGLAWDYRNDLVVALTPDKPVYTPGETARILVKSPIAGLAWVCIERENVRRSFQVRLEGNAPSFSVPIEPGDVPNVFVSVTLVRGAEDSSHQSKTPEYRIGYCELLVEDPASRLQVQVQPSLTNCLPAQPLEVATLVRDHSGRPVPDAEVAFYAVDDGVLSLTGYSAPDLHSVFLSSRPLRVATASSLPALMSEDLDALQFQNKGYLGGGGGFAHIRQNFLACAFWAGSLQTGPDGKAIARFTAPDNLTRYRLIAVVHTADNRFGTGTSAFVVSKPLLLEPVLPLFANVGDTLQARALLSNQTDSNCSVRVLLELDSCAQSQSTNLTRIVEVPARGSATVDFPLILTTLGEAGWTWRAQIAGEGGFADAVRSSLKVGSAAPLLREVHHVTLPPGETNLLALLSPQLFEGSGTVTVHLANSPVVGLGEAMRHLLHYPYGCAEQTGSSLLPWLVLRQSPALLTFAGVSEAEAEAAARAGVTRLLSMQTPSGGLAYWPGGSEPMLWASAYGALVVARAQAAGVPVPEPEFNALLNYIQAKLIEPGNLNADSLCLGAYALATAQRADFSLHTRLYGERDRFSTEDRALLALAIATGEKDFNHARTLLEKLPARASQTLAPFAGGSREKALQLLAWTACDPQAPITKKLFHELDAQRRQGHWSTTQGNAWALMAMEAYLRQQSPITGNLAGAIRCGAEQQGFQLTPKCGVTTHAFTFSPNGAAPLTITNASSGSLYAELRVDSRLSHPHVQAQDHGFTLERTYARLNDKNQPEPAAAWRVGDRVLVTLNVSVPEAAQYVALEDPLPGVLEAINPEFQPAAAAAQETVSSWYSDYREIRADRVLFFANQLPQGRYVVRYLARVRAAGVVTAPAAKIEAMYQPNRFGLSQPLTISSRPLN